MYGLRSWDDRFLSVSLSLSASPSASLSLSASSSPSPSPQPSDDESDGLAKTVMRLNEAKSYLKKVFMDTDGRLVPFIWGAPGVGKSSIVSQIAEENRWRLIDLRLSLLNPVDIRGLPYFSKERNEAIWLKPEFLPTDGQGILFLDELNTAPPSTQVAAYQLVLDRRVGNYIFPDHWRICAAGNRETDYAQVTKMPSPLANRLIHLEVGAHIDDWKIWARGRIDSRVISFLNFRPDLLSTVPKEESKAYPTPRSWEYVSRIARLYNDLGQAVPLIAGAVGEGAGKEFVVFLSIYKDLPDVHAILRGELSDVPEKLDTCYALVGALVLHLRDEYLSNFLAYVRKLSPEFTTLAIKDAGESGWRDKLKSLPEWEGFADEYVEYFK